MKILVFAHRLEVGGTQVNAIELTAALRDTHGQEVLLFATPGPMVNLAEEKGLRFLPAPAADAHPSLRRMRALGEVIRRETPDLIHVWDWPQCLDAYAAYLKHRIPMVVTCMSMMVPRMLPKAVPTTFGTPELLDYARAAGRTRLKLVLPPVDVRLNAPHAVDAQPFRAKFCIEDGDLVLVTVGRLVEWMKAESLRRTIDAVRTLGRHLPLRFVIVGDGTSRAELERLARETNSELGRTAVILTGALLDPRPAYAAADVVVGMGGSALRGMAFGKPVVVVGERGFSAPFTPETANSFYYKGIYGLGDGSSSNSRLISDIRVLAQRRDEFREVGDFARKFVLRHFSLDSVSAQLNEFLGVAVKEVPGFHVAAADGVRTAAIVMGQKLVPNTLRRII